jgi:hypothetical protein
MPIHEEDEAQYRRCEEGMECPFQELPLRSHEQLREDQEEWGDDRIDVLTAQDMRQFLRAGFHQMCDPLVLDASTDYMYILPKGIQEPMRSVEEVLKVEIVKPPPPKPKRSAEEKRFQELIEHMHRNKTSTSKVLNSTANSRNSRTPTYIQDHGTGNAANETRAATIGRQNPAPRGY